MKLPRPVFLVLVLVLQVPGCGYSTRSLYDPGIQTVAVDVFKNETFRRDLELDLTRKVARQLRLKTPWRVANRSRADAVLTGRIVAAQERVLSEDNRDLVFESSVIVQVEAELKNLHTGEVIKKIRRRSQVAFLVPRGEDQATAFDRSLTDLAEDIVQALEDWN